VHEVQVDGVQAQLREALVDRGERLVTGLAVVPELRRDEQLVPRDAAGGDGTSDAFLVAVDGRGVDVAVTGLEGVADDALGLRGIDFEDAEAELRDGVSVVEGEEGNLMSSSVGGAATVRVDAAASTGMGCSAHRGPSEGSLRLSGREADT
jgi:hypothetical protein